VSLAPILSTPKGQSHAITFLGMHDPFSNSHPEPPPTQVSISHTKKVFTLVRLTSLGKASGSRTQNLGSCLQKSAAAATDRPELLLPVLEEAAKPEGDKLENRLQDKDNGEDVIANLQGFIENLGYGHRTEVRR